ncbi:MULTISPECIES: eIF2A-related protein [Streptomyces]|uniref:Trypsin-like peptidase domain-containing protein n=1 Tax=Streptomyces ramulosus TaxID=47762 RepID=A0ABW1FBW1_9ACTN
MAASVVKVLTADGGVAGAGFLAGDDIAFTCAHVVRAAGQGPGGQVRLAFANLPDAQEVSGRVLSEGWRGPEGEDVAVLRLADVPAGAGPLALGPCEGTRGHRIVSYGFPAQAPRSGHFGYGTAGGLLARSERTGRLLQLSEANDLTSGFSGAPVVDEATGLAIGMVTAITSPDTHLRGLGVAYATPTEVLREARPELAVSQLCPYLGLEPFTAQDADLFHGREAAVEKVLTALGGQRRMVMLLGPSGAGKSSLVKAGVLPALARGAIPGGDRWLPLLARPGQDLLAGLERAGLPGASSRGLLAAAEERLASAPGHHRLLLIIDQFEELLTQPGPTAQEPGADRRLRAADQLVELHDSHAAVTVVLIMRNDFYAPLDALAPHLMNAAVPGLLNVPATLSAPELEAIITGPARSVGLPMQAGLANRIRDDVLEADPATRQAPVTLLPPLELALRELWERREDGRLTHAAYDRIGKVTGSLTAWCNTALAQMPAAHRPTAQRILTALVRPADEPDGIPATRQPVSLTRLRALAADPHLTGPAAADAFDTVLAALTRHRIITTGAAPDHDQASGDPVAELIHDALLRDWSDLREWVARDHRFHAWLHRTTEQAKRYADSGDTADLLVGTALAEAIDWAGQRSLPADVTAFLTASRQHQLASVRRTRRVIAMLAGMLSLALIATGVAFWQRQTAVTAQEHALAAQRQAQSRQLASQSTTLLSTDPDLASLLALQAYRRSHTEEATTALYDAAALPLRQRLAGHTDQVWDVAFSPDGKTLASGGVDTTVRLWNPETGKARATLTDHSDTEEGINDIAFSPDGKYLASVGNAVRLRDADTGRTRRVLNSPHVEAHSVAFSPDGKTLAIGGFGGELLLWDMGADTPRKTVELGAGTVEQLAYSPDGKTLAAIGEDAKIRLLDPADGKLRGTLTGHTQLVNSLAFSPDGETLATGSVDRTVRLWNPRDGKLRRTLRGHTESVEAVAFSPNGETLASGDLDGTVRLWDMTTGTARETLTARGTNATSLAFSPDGRRLATGHADKKVRLWDTTTARTRTTLAGHTNAVNSLAYAPDGKTLDSASADTELKRWDMARTRGRTLRPRSATADYSVALSPNGKTLAISDGRIVSLMDTESGERLVTIEAGTFSALEFDSVTEVAFSPDGKMLATGRMRGTVKLWDVATGAARGTLQGRIGPVFALAFSPDGRQLASGSKDGARLWKVTPGTSRRVSIRLTRDAEVQAVAFSPDGKTVATGSVNHTIRLRDTATGAARGTLQDPTGPVSALAFSPDGTLLASGSEGKTVRLWDLATQKSRYTLTGHAKGVWALAFSPDGRQLASGSEDKTVRIWNVDLPDPAEAGEQICKAVDRNFTRDERAIYLKGQPSSRPCPTSAP